ncbi:tetratricopeptide repeat protein [Paraburkholderia bonniea]|uniref:tetratricopeptide repeat protein n=1 Tax=Paraburkholderia bonniea TaxID=2152891 RepID=UPI0012929CA3|nr:tetratricopeptide repeat protein [Paraburkholderia bonniea]
MKALRWYYMLAAIQAITAVPASAQVQVQAQTQACQLDLAQQLFALKPRPDARIETLLAACDAEAASDYRVDLLRGGAARDAGQLEQAVRALQHAHQLAPHELAPTLELATTYEWRGDLRAARQLNDEALAATPTSRAALLGAARVARAQHRPAEARALYTRLLAIDPDDAEALSGLAWLELDSKHFSAARAQFEAELKAHPDDLNAQAGLEQLKQSWRYQFDAGASVYSLAAGTAYGGTAQLQVALNDTDTLLFGVGHNTRELPTENPNDPTPLPSNYGRIGFQRLVPGSYHWGIAYEFRERSAQNGENRVEVNLGSYLTRTVQWFAGVRQGFPSPWENRLVYAGLSAPVIERWSATLTSYYGHAESASDSQALVLDLTREGPGQLLYNLGAGYNFEPRSFIVHGRVVWPVTTRQALTFGIEHRSFGNELEAALGWRINWQ